MEAFELTDNLTRQSGIFNGSNSLITIVGAGGIGSPTTLALSKMGCTNIKIYDHDTVDKENIASQLHSPLNLGMNKTESLAVAIEEMTGTLLNTAPKKFDEGTDLEDSLIVLGAVDQMSVRREIFNSWTRQKTPILIDSRMGGQAGEVHVLFREHEEEIKTYEKEFLYSDEEASPEPCSEKAIIYNTFILGGLIADVVKKILNGEQCPKRIILDTKNLQLWPYY